MAAASAFFARTSGNATGPSRHSAELQALGLERTPSGGGGSSGELTSRRVASFTAGPGRRSLSGRPEARFPTTSAGYQLHAKLGEGVTATVYLATCKPLRCTVAVKLLDLEAIEAAGGLDVVIKETAVMAGMSHPNVLPLLASFVEGGSLWMVLPYYASGSLLSIIQYRHPDGLTDWMAVATVMREVARGLAYMHQSGRIHRDLKAANILVAPDGKVALADFGVSAALDAAPDEEPAAQTQHQPGAQTPKAYDAGAMLRRASMQQQSGTYAAQSSAMGVPGGGGEGSGRSSKGMTAAEYRAARRAGKLSPNSAPSLLTQSLGGKQQMGEEGTVGGSFNRRVFSNASSAKQYLSRNTFVGTPCWMAPEVMAPQQGVGYGQAADIWSFGITMLEVATGKAPTARRSVNEILISVLSSPEDDPSSIAGELSHTPETFQEVVYSCLAKNPAERPTAQQLLQMRFFKTLAMAPQSLARNLLAGVPLVTERDDSASPYESKAPKDETELGDISGSRRFSRSNASVSGTRSGQSGGSIALNMREFLETAVQLLQQLGRGDLPPDRQKYKFSVDDLRSARGFGFCVIKRGKYIRAPAKGRGFVIAKLPGAEGAPTCWSAPSWYTSRSNASGFTTGNDEVACIFTVREQGDLEGFCSDVKTPCRADVGHKNRHLLSCRSLCTANFTQLSLSKGGVVNSDREANEQLYGEGADADMIVGGRVRPPPQFNALYEELKALLDDEPLEGSHGHLDTPEAARNVSAALTERISNSSFPAAGDGQNGRQRRATDFVQGSGDAGRDGGAPAATGMLRLRSFQHNSSGPQILENDAASGPSHMRSASFQSANIGPIPQGAEEAEAGGTQLAAPGPPSLSRNSIRTSAPDLGKLSMHSVAQTDGTSMTDLQSLEDSSSGNLLALERDDAGEQQAGSFAFPSPLRSAAATDDVADDDHSVRLANLTAGERITSPIPPRRNIEGHSPGPGEDSAMNLVWSPTARGSVAAIPSSAFAPDPRQAGEEQGEAAGNWRAVLAAQKAGASQLAGVSPPVGPGHPGHANLLAGAVEHDSSSSGRGGDRGSFDEKSRTRRGAPDGEGFARPASLPGITTGGNEDRFPPPLSPNHSWGGGARPRTPAGLEPVLEDATLIGTLPRHPSSGGHTSSGGNTPDASIFDIGALSRQDADREHAAAMAALDDGDSSEATTPTNRRPRDMGGSPRTPGGGKALRNPRNLTSASANPRPPGAADKQAPGDCGAKEEGSLGRDEFRWSFEDGEEFDAAKSYSRRQSKSSVNLPGRSSLSEAELGELMEIAQTASHHGSVGGSTGAGSGGGGKGSALAKFGQFVYSSHLSNSKWSHVPF